MILVIADRCPCVLGLHLHLVDLGCVCLEPRQPRFEDSLRCQLGDDRLDLAVVEGLAHLKPCMELLETIKSRRPDVPVFFVVPSLSDREVCELLGRGARYCFQDAPDINQFMAQVRALVAMKPGAAARRAPLPLLPAKATGSSADDPVVPENILRAIRYAEDHATDRDLSIEGLARIACMSPYHFCRVFKKHTSKSPMQYVNFIRVERAKTFLANSPRRMTVATIANLLGFYDSSCFNRHFKKITGQTPTTFKQGNNELG